MRKICATALASLAIFDFDRPANSTALPPLAIVDVQIVDAARGRIAGQRTVLIIDGHIASIDSAKAKTIPQDTIRIDGRGKFLIPGLVDMHVHLFNNSSHRPPNDWAFPLFIANGVTAVREMRTDIEQIAQIAKWREAVTSGELIAPHVVAAGVFVHADSDDALREEVRTAARSGADFIKIFSEVPAAPWRVILDEARSIHLPVDGHVPATVRWIDAARAGQRTAEHLMQTYEACSSIENDVLNARQGLDGDAATALRDDQERKVLEHFDAAACARSAKAVAATRQVQVPTLVLSHNEATWTGVGYAADPRWRHLRADEQVRWQRILSQAISDDAALASLRWKISCRIVRSLHDAGVPILAGTDAPMPMDYPGYSLHDEIELLVECGLSNAEALRAATSGPAEVLKLTKSGKIETGNVADLVLLDADPLQDIRNLRRIRAVVLAGRLLTHEALDGLLEAK